MGTRFKILFTSGWFSLVLLFIGCQENGLKQQGYPLIKTLKVASVDNTGAVFSGEVIKPGKDKVIDHGFVWSTSPRPTIDNFMISLGSEMPPTFSTKVGFDLVANKEYTVRVYAITVNAIVYGADETFTSLGSTSPAIISFSPKNGIDGDTIRIVGENFGSTLASNTAKVGGVVAVVTHASSTLTKILVPKMPATGPVKIEITSNNKAFTSAEVFVVEHPVISSFTPVRGPDGTSVTITGDFFSINKAYNKIAFNGTLATISQSSRKQIIVQSPVMPFAGYTKITVDVNGKASSSADDYFVEGPYITSIAPGSGKYNDMITLNGEGFSSTPAENIVKFGLFTATVISSTGTSIQVLVPDLAGDPVSITVSRANKTNTFLTSFIVNNPWHKGPVIFPGPERGMAAAFSIGNSGFIATGRIADYSLFAGQSREVYNDLWEFNSSTNSWTKRADFPGTARYSSTGFSIGTKGYVGLGLTQNEIYQSDFYEYDPQTNTWTRIANLPGTGREGAVGFSVGGKGYVGLGRKPSSGGPFVSDFFEYDQASNTWQQFAGPGIAYFNDFGFSLNGKGYVVIHGKELWELDPINRSWTRKADYPDNSLLGSFTFTIGNKAYAGSGFNNTINDPLTYSRNFYQYDPLANQWTELQGFQYLKRFTGVAFGLGNKGYVVTGQSNAASGVNNPYYYLSDFWVFDPN